MRFALYLGCTVPVRAMNYELAARRTAQELGIDLVDVDGFACCGYPAKPMNWEAGLLMAANTLALAEEHGLHICTLCNACTGTLAECNKLLKENEALRARINAQLSASTGRRYEATISVRHFARILYEEVGMEQLQQRVSQVRDRGLGVALADFAFAVHHGCHYSRPADVYGGFDDAENPHTLSELVQALGATLVSYGHENECCGGGILAMDKDTALSIAKSKLDRIHAAQADGLVLVCPFCDIMYEVNQRSIERQYGVTYRLPVFYYPQLLGLALGFTPEELGFRLNRVKSRKLLERFQA